MKKIIYGIVIILLIGIMLISSYFIFKDKQEDKKQENTFEELVEIAEDKEQKDYGRDGIVPHVTQILRLFTLLHLFYRVQSCRIGPAFKRVQILFF